MWDFFSLFFFFFFEEKRKGGKWVFQPLTHRCRAIEKVRSTSYPDTGRSQCETNRIKERV